MALPWHADRVSQSRALADSDRNRDPLAAAVGRAELEAWQEDFGRAEEILVDAVKTYRASWMSHHDAFKRILNSLFIIQRLDLAAELLRTRFKTQFRVELDSGLDNPFAAVRCEFISREAARFVFDIGIRRNGRLSDVWWFAGAFPLLAHYVENGPRVFGTVMLNHEDIGGTPGLSYGDCRSDFFLVPDHIFLASRGYEHFFRCYKENFVPWDARRAVAFWRSSTTGHTTGRVEDQSKTWQSLPRVKLCEIGRASDGLIDAGITNIVQVRSPEAIAAIKASGLMRPHAPESEFINYKYQIDIDGNTNSWPGLFQKLCTGSTVLKVTSPFGYRQWFYERLKPWINFVPVESDMSDLIEKIRWLEEHDAKAKEIGSSGFALAKSMDFKSELDRGAESIAAAIKFFAGKAGTHVAPERAGPAAVGSKTPATSDSAARRRTWEYLCRPAYLKRYALARDYLASAGSIIELGGAPEYSPLLISSSQQRLTVVVWPAIGDHVGAIDPGLSADERRAAARYVYCDASALDADVYASHEAVAILGVDLDPIVTADLIPKLSRVQKLLIEGAVDWPPYEGLKRKLFDSGKWRRTERILLDLTENPTPVGRDSWQPRPLREIIFFQNRKQSKADDRLSAGTIVNHRNVEELLLPEAKWADGHGVENCRSIGATMLYYAIVHMNRARTCVCLGSGGALVPRAMRTAQRDLGLVGARTILVDGNMGSWGRPNYLSHDSFFRRHFADVELVQTTTDDFATRAKRDGLVIDYLHIDADHSFEAALSDFVNFESCIAETGLVTLHDTNGAVPCSGVVIELQRRGHMVINLPWIGAGVALIQPRTGFDNTLPDAATDAFNAAARDARS